MAKEILLKKKSCDSITEYKIRMISKFFKNEIKGPN